MRGKSLVILMKALPVLKPFALISYRWRWRQKAPIRIFSLKHTDSHQHKNTFALLHVPKRFHTPSAASRVRSHQLGYITVVCCCDTKLNLVFLFPLLCAAVLPSSRPQVRKLLCAWICVCVYVLCCRQEGHDQKMLSIYQYKDKGQRSSSFLLNLHCCNLALNLWLVWLFTHRNFDPMLNLESRTVLKPRAHSRTLSVADKQGRMLFGSSPLCAICIRRHRNWGLPTLFFGWMPTQTRKWQTHNMAM